MILPFLFTIIFTLTHAQSITCENHVFPELPYSDNVLDQTQQWNYEQQELWSNFEQCTLDVNPIQSPIDLSVQTERLSTYDVLMNNIQIKDEQWIIPVTRDYQGSVAIHSNISTIQFTNEYGIEKKFDSHHIVMKFPSEHSLNGHQFVGEIQIAYLVQEEHCAIEGNNLAYLSIFLEVDQIEDQPFFENVANQTLGYFENFDFQQNITNALRSGASSYIQYEGTQSNPPCDKATWIVLTTPKLINQEQLNKLTQFYGSINRQQQPLGRRIFAKGTFHYEREYLDNSSYDSSKTWIVLYMATIITLVVLLLAALIMGMWKLAHMSKYRHIEEQKQETLAPKDDGLQGVVD